MKIVYIIESLVLKGGTERIISEKANYLSEKYGYEIYIISCTQKYNQPNAFPLLESINQINLGIPYYSQYRFKYPKRLWVKHVTNKELRCSISNVIHQISPDIIIGIGHFKANLVCTLKCQAIKIIECHEARSFTLLETGKRKSLFWRLYINIYRRKYFSTIEKKADAVITLTKGDKNEWRKAKYTKVIPNFSMMQISHISNCEQKRIISVGRLEWEKGYERLLDVWEKVSVRYPEWKLDIFGEGNQYEKLQKKIKNKGIKNICIHNATENISQEYANSSICVITSLYEGFALVLLEALRHGVPCIAYDCPFGPGSIIEDNKCGFLIKNGNITDYIMKVSQLIENESLRKDFSQKAIIRADCFSVDSIMKEWKDLFEQLLYKRI